MDAFGTEQSATRYNLDGDDPDNDIDQYLEDLPNITQTVPLGDGTAYAITEERSEYLERAENTVKAAGLFDAIDRGDTGYIAEEIFGDNGTASSSGADELATVIKDHLDDSDEADNSTDGVFSRFFGDVPDHLIAEGLREHTAVGKYIDG